MAKVDRLQEALYRVVDHYDLPRLEVKAMMYEEDYPPLEPGDLGQYEEILFEEDDYEW